VDSLCVRFYEEPTIFQEIINFLPEQEYYFAPIEKDAQNIYKFSREQLHEELKNIQVKDFIILEHKMTWALIYDKHRKLIALGGYIIKQMKKNTQLKFGDTRIMSFSSQ